MAIARQVGSTLGIFFFLARKKDSRQSRRHPVGSLFVTHTGDQAIELAKAFILLQGVKDALEFQFRSRSPHDVIPGGWGGGGYIPAKHQPDVGPLGTSLRADGEVFELKAYRPANFDHLAIK